MKELKRIDHLILRYIGVKSPQEISDMTGIPAEEIVSKAKELFSTIDVLTRPERINKLILRMETLAEEVYDRIQNTDDRNVSGMVNSMRQLYAKVIDELKDLQRMADDEYLEMQTKYAMMMSQMIGEAFERTMRNLSEEFKSIPYETIEVEFRDNLRSVTEKYSEDV